MSFQCAFEDLTGYPPLSWQVRLFETHFKKGEIPSAIDLPTGLGKTSVMAIWLIALAQGAPLPRRLIYVVDRRAVVDQATAVAEQLRERLSSELIQGLSLGDGALPLSTLRGEYRDNRDWLADPSRPAIVVGTVDMIGSRLLFEGYGVSRKMRPYHAGLLGIDSLVVLDEAHLVPPFLHLLNAIQSDARLGATSDCPITIKKMKVLPLSATQRAQAGAPRDFALSAEDREDPVVNKRLSAAKALKLIELETGNADQQVAREAWALANRDGFRRVVVFCDRRDKKDDGATASAQGVKEAMEALAKDGKGKILFDVELLVGGRRVHERQQVEDWLIQFGFMGERRPLERPAILIATSAGEVGVDLNADDMVCDLVAWERMVQRLGRVNRRGEGHAQVRVFWSTPTVKKAGEPTDAEQRAARAFKVKDLLESLPQANDGFDASPGALRDFSAANGNAVREASSPEPLRPAMTRALADAWSMTSLEEHTGRPEVGPWLRGWIDEKPQCTLVWRRHLPVRQADDWNPNANRKQAKEISAFFEAAPLQTVEMLETETFRVAEWLASRAKALTTKKQGDKPQDKSGTLEEGGGEAEQEIKPTAESGAATAAGQAAPLTRKDIVLIALSNAGDFAQQYTLNNLAQDRSPGQKEAFERALVGRILVIDVRFGGLSDGMLDPKATATPETADGDAPWVGTTFRVGRFTGEEDPAGDWREEDRFEVEVDGEGEATEWLRVDHRRNAANAEDSRSLAPRPQSLAEHQSWTEERARAIAQRLALPPDAEDALALAARLHDEGKKSARWQRAFNAPRGEVWAKTKGPLDHKRLEGYRHEFGSIPNVEKQLESLDFSPDWQDLVLHLVAAHHGQARPVIDTDACEDAPPSALKERARDVALRFARLQKRWGPWGLAWWEALLRAADVQASKDNDEENRHG
jgi:CRISPR-associated endonuclease/helicase Cas3